VREGLAIPRLLGEHRVRYMPGAIIGFLGLRALLGVLGRADCTGLLLSGVHTKTLESNRALETLAARRMNWQRRSRNMSRTSCRAPSRRMVMAANS
jgi:hypothetical protein